jgi:hypothetical protein
MRQVIKDLFRRFAPAFVLDMCQLIPPTINMATRSRLPFSSENIQSPGSLACSVQFAV